MPTIKPDADTYRLRAISFILQNKLKLARREAEKAAEIARDHPAVQYLGAVLDYLSGLVPSALQGSFPPWPKPVPWDLVKGDDDSLIRFRRAAETFKVLEDRAPSDSTSPGRQCLPLWRLACLSNDPEKQDEASLCCRNALANDPAQYPYVIWALARGYNFDLQASRCALEHLVLHEEAAVPHIATLVALVLNQNQAEAALQILDSQKHLFKDGDDEAIWRFWKAQALQAAGKRVEAISLLGPFAHDAHLRHLYGRLLVDQARNLGNWDTAFQFLEEAACRTNDPQITLLLCQAKAENRQWDFVSKHVSKLMEGVPSLEAVELAAYATYNLRQYDDCIEMLAKYAEMVKKGRLPFNLAQIRRECLKDLGRLPEALDSAEAIAQENPSPDNLIALAHIQTQLGDFRAASITARQLVGRKDTRIQDLLEMARLARPEDMGIARRLWDQAIKNEIPDEWVPFALTLGYDLGLDKKVGPLVKRMAGLAQKDQAGVKLLTFPQTIEMLKERNQEQADLLKAYRQGLRPVHAVARTMNLGMAWLFHGLLDSNEVCSDPSEKGPLYVRHGSRAATTLLVKGGASYSLVLDTSAILLAHHLGIMEHVEKAFAPLLLPSSLPAALAALKESSRVHQPSRLEAAHAIASLVEKKQLQIASEAPPSSDPLDLGALRNDPVASLLEVAIEKDGFVLDFLPVMNVERNEPFSPVPDLAATRLVDCIAVAESLRAYGPLSEQEYGRALSVLAEGNRGSKSQIRPAMGATLLLSPGTTELLNSMGLLHMVSDRFQTCITQSEWVEIRGMIQADAIRMELATWLSDLSDRIVVGLKQKIYRLLPAPAPSSTDADHPVHADPLIQSLMATLKCQGESNWCLWIEDRMISGSTSLSPYPIVSILDVLKGLLHKKAITAEEYYWLLDRLRRADIRFLPLDTDELLYQLGQAHIGDGCLVETRELATLRQYASACLLDKEALQPPRGSQQPGEAPLLIHHHRAVTEALLALWRLSAPNDEVKAKSEWLLSNLYLELPALLATPGWPGFQENSRYAAAVGLAGLLSRTIDFPVERSSLSSPARKRFCDWLFKRLIAPKLDADSHLLGELVQVLKSSLMEIAPYVDDPKEIATSRAIYWGFCQDLPDIVRTALTEDPKIANFIGLQKQPIATVRGLQFDRGQFFAAAAEAINGRSATLAPLSSTIEMAFAPAPPRAAAGCFTLTDPTKGISEVIGGYGLEALIEAPTERERVIETARTAYDCSRDTLSKASLAISNQEGIADKVGTLQQLLDTSATEYYSRFLDRLRKEPAFQFVDLRPPSALGLLRHLRLDGDKIGQSGSFPQNWAKAAEIMLEEEELAEMLLRLSSLPVPLPKPVLDSVSAQPQGTLRKLIRKLLCPSSSPLRCLHFMKLLSLYETSWPWAHRLKRRHASALLSPSGLDAIEAYIALLRWVYEDLRTWPDIGSLPPQMRLVLSWAHADRLFSILRELDAPIDLIKGTFQGSFPHLPSNLLDPHSELIDDAAYPGSIDALSFVFGGIAYSFGENIIPLKDSLIRKRVTSLVFRQLEPTPFPALPFLRDPMLSDNVLGAFLAFNKGPSISPFLDDAVASIFSSENLHGFAEHAIGTLEQDITNRNAWIILHALIGDRPPYRDLKDRLIALSWSFARSSEVLSNENPALAALQTLSLQCRHYSDPGLAESLQQQCLSFCKGHAAQATSKLNEGAQSPETAEDFYFVMLDCAIRLCQAGPPSTEWPLAFADFVSQSYFLDQRFASIARPLVQRLVEELPTPMAIHFAPLLAKLRTSMAWP